MCDFAPDETRTHENIDTVDARTTSKPRGTPVLWQQNYPTEVHYNNIVMQ